MSGALCRRDKASFYNGLLWGLPTSTGYFAQMFMDVHVSGHFLHSLLSSPCIIRAESSFLSMYLAISASDLSAICNIKASVSMELNGNKREASIND
ncbi:hypothetical protein CHARACLAT_005817 [Characodon lateralis]|uniref:Uncharacterized protein n=1 Tax=Characodon lateralis TaxID=208331 RepID=A0ABU7CNY3_9TELE|nr:hypothetical protein [Characodon lateralis]